MISVCVPIYNYDVRPLIGELASQASALQDTEVELVAIDDGSDPQHKAINEGIERLCRLVTLDRNVGRSRVRNLFLEHTRGDYLLFLDNDMVIGPGFLARYAATLPAHPDVVVGGIAYDKRGNNDAHRLRYLYGTTVESRPADERRKRPYASFMTGNFMIRRVVMEKIRFDESLAGYGHEDTLFGYELQRAAVAITHIDNPAVNGQVEPNAEFLAKTHAAVRNLAVLYRRLHDDEAFCRSVRLLDAYRRLIRWRATWAVRLAWLLLRWPMESHFIAGNAINIRQFSFYKLGLLCDVLKSER